jgi:RNA polymerase sigma-70 factor (ECF subfamily)
MDDQTAIALLKHGDLTGLETLVHRYQVKALYVAVLIVQERPQAEEVVQAAFVRAAEKISQFDDSRPFGPWFLRSVVNAAIKAARRQDRTVSLDELDKDASPLDRWLTDPHPGPEQLLELEESRQNIREALDRLSPEQRSVVVMRYYLEMSEAEMSARLGRPLDTIKWWLRTARHRLRGILYDYGVFKDSE